VETSVGPGARWLRSRHLAGGISASVHAIDVIDGRGRPRRLVLKRFLWDDPSEPDMAGREARILELVRAIPLPTPEPVAVDRTGEEAGAPSLVMTRLPGAPVLRPRDVGPWVRQLAELLPPIHALDVAGQDLDVYRPYGVQREVEIPSSTRHRAAWERAIEVFKGPPPEPPATFIHRDYHPGNVLWHRGRPAGVIDWLHGCLGAPGADVGHCRINLWHLAGMEVADRLLAAYRSLMPSAPPYHPYWDLAAALGLWAEPMDLEEFVLDAVRRL
jgi:aminoglycoside phosphotransferase (APT) family kinase protein